MACYAPLRAWRGKVQPSGKRSVVFRRSEAALPVPLDLPCGQCIGCRLERSRQWAIRCLHESQLHEESCFVTLTYSDESLPVGGSLPVYKGGDFQLFMKRLRKRVGKPIRFFACGEYGELLQRPHFHACLFGWSPEDKQVFSKSGAGHRLYKSELLDLVWQKGHTWVGDVTFESAAYVARYVLKKVTGDAKAEHYGGKVPEHVSMSRKPGLAAGWYEKFKSDVFPSDECVVRGLPLKPPKFYDKLFEKEAPRAFARLKRKRVVEANKVGWNERSLARLKVKEVVKAARLRGLSRNLEATHAH